MSHRRKDEVREFSTCVSYLPSVALSASLVIMVMSD